MATTLGIEAYQVQLGGPKAEAALAGVIAERQFGTDNAFKSQLGNAIDELKRNGHAELAGKLTAARADITANPPWRPVSMTDAELRQEVARSKAAAERLTAIATMSRSAGAGLFVQGVANGFTDGYRRMETELNRRQKNN
ncbi:MAG: hypothetical protein HQL35_06645 [Alphaproteobacteria bacterium]|nr:hypothetical protein [Alphaproteobacteria bacterium]